jgi:signal transduction histidine kinase
VAARARQVTGGALAFVALPVEGDRLLVEVADGAGAEGLRGQLFDRAGSLLGDVVEDGQIRRVLPGDLTAGPPGEGLVVPLGGSGADNRGVLVVTGLAVPALVVATRALGSFAAQAAVALELAERRRDSERFAVLEDRDRIARDLHDLVIQRLFATGMRLQSVLRLIRTDPEAAVARVDLAVDDLDATIRELRSTIYGLQAPVDGRPSLRARLLEVVDAGTQHLGFTPALRLDGLLDTLVPPDVAEHVLATVREALSNAARHAAAHQVEVGVALRGRTLRVVVEDDGVGVRPEAARSGLRNLAGRAAELDGVLLLEPGRLGGTRLTWEVPVGPPGPTPAG